MMIEAFYVNRYSREHLNRACRQRLPGQLNRVEGFGVLKDAISTKKRKMVNCLPLAYTTRETTCAILQDVADTGVLFAILMCKNKVISLVVLQKASLHPDDMTSESFSPICLPRYNSMAFLYAYVHYLDVDTYLTLLTTSSQAFFHLKECRIQIEAILAKSNVLNEVERSLSEDGMRIEDLPVDPSAISGSLFLLTHHKTPTNGTVTGVGGPSRLWHFIYRSIYLDQLYRAYQRLYASMHDKGVGPHKTQFRRDENYVLLCWVTHDFELYAAFDPLADKIRGWWVVLQQEQKCNARTIIIFINYFLS
ncbi:unnamed protein product [Lactuca virosa]|uniref:Vacuolar fusion protein MON1 homolog n=1 Tax=Lactuca virosa TaxID=75947 RepID=A0AAU9PS30_9ASTR|nr:unnamed protein product [Lactuca virosa]